MKEIMPRENLMLSNFYRTKMMVSNLGLGYQNIDCYINGCMLYYKDNVDKQQCTLCHALQYVCRVSHKGYKNVARKQMWYLPLSPRL